MFGNTDQGPRGELSGHPDAGTDKMLQSIVMEMIKGMDPSTLAGLLRNAKGETYNFSNAKPAAAKTVAATSKKSIQYTEQQRVEELESMRVPENSYLVDEAIKSGEDPRALALRFVKTSIEQDEAANEIIAEMNRLVAERSKPATTRAQAIPPATGDEVVDDIVAEMLRLSNGRTP